MPRFTYDACGDVGSTQCEMACTNSGRYCHTKLENEHLWGRVVADENIRQACLYNVLETAEGGDTRNYWKYKTWFQDNCKNIKQTFNHLCSSAVRPSESTASSV